MEKIIGAHLPPFDSLEETPERKKTAEKYEAVKEVKAVRSPYCTDGFYIPERRIPAAQKASEYITISVAEYHFLTKAATHLEVILADKTYGHENVVEAVRAAMQGLLGAAEAGADQ